MSRLGPEAGGSGGAAAPLATTRQTNYQKRGSVSLELHTGLILVVILKETKIIVMLMLMIMVIVMVMCNSHGTSDRSSNSNNNIGSNSI